MLVFNADAETCVVCYAFYFEMRRAKRHAYVSDFFGFSLSLISLC